MPHITIEHSANLAEHHDIQALVDAVHAVALDHGLPAVEGLRTRAATREHYRIADGDPRFAFAAIHCRIALGRSEDAKRTFMERVLGAAEAFVADGPLVVAWSIEIVEMNPANRINHNHVRTVMEAS